jgi:hypothetical protein
MGPPPSAEVKENMDLLILSTSYPYFEVCLLLSAANLMAIWTQYIVFKS